MRLVVTGLFVRASRNARLAALPPPVRAPSLISVRWASNTQTAEKEVWWDDEPKGVVGDLARPIQKIEPKQPPNPHTKPNSETAWDTGELLKDHLIKQNKPNQILQAYGESGILIASNPYVFDNTTNLSPSITALLNRTLYNQPNHPICITRKLIESVFAAPDFKNHIATDPVATTQANFDVLGFPADHPGRARSDTYYLDEKHVLRTHTSAHQHDAFQHMLQNGEKGFTICADVFRRDSIDRSHFPVFHQMEGARMWAYPSREKTSRFERHMARKEMIKQDVNALPKQTGVEVVEQCSAFDLKSNPKQRQHDDQDVRLVVSHLMRSLQGLVYKVFTAAQAQAQSAATITPDTLTPEKLKVRWVEAYFPFTAPSFELEVFWQGEWLELLGCGVTQERILANAGLENHIGWAWGIGVERLAMILFGIPDIRLFWSQDPRFLSQFKEGEIKRYEPFSKYPACYKDVAFWINDASPTETSAAAAGGNIPKGVKGTPKAAFHENDVMEIVRDVAGSLAEDVKLVDEFVHPTTGRKSVCYRVNYRSLEKTLTNEEVNAMHAEVVGRLGSELGIELR